MKFVKLFPPVADTGEDEHCVIGGVTVRLSDIAFAKLDACAPGVLKWVDGGSAILFSTPSRVFALLKICTITTQDMQRSATELSTYLVSITRGEGLLIVRAEALGNGDAAVTGCLNREIPLAELPPDTSLESMVDVLRTLAEHCVSDAVHDGSVRTIMPWLAKQLPAAPSLAKTSHVVTSKSRPLGVALLKHAPLGKWHTTLTPFVSCVRLHDQASHIFITEHLSADMLARICSWCNDSAFPGYPYPLILADQLARVTHNERDTWKLIIASDEDAAKIINAEVKASDAHAMFEHILYGKPM